MIMHENNFLDELLLEAEQNEIKQTAAYFDLILIEVGKLQSQIESNFAEAEKEIEIIKEWSLNKNSKLQDKINFLSQKLEAFIKAECKKTIELPHGELRYHKRSDRIEISNLDEFFRTATGGMIRIKPEEVLPDLNKIKAYIKNKGRVPNGVIVIEGKEEFSYKLNRKED